MIQVKTITDVNTYNTLLFQTIRWAEGTVSYPYADSEEILTMMSRRILLLALMVMTLWPASLFAGNGYVLKDGDNLKAKDVPMCLEMLEILNLPENSHTIGLFNQNNPIVFPERYKSFKPVDWAPLSLQDVEKYFDKDRLQKGLEEKKQEALTRQDWNGKADFLFEETHVDLDDTGNTITMLRYRLPTWKQWNCLLGNDAPPRYFETFNYKIRHDSMYGDGLECMVFTYGGRLYFSGSFGDRLTIYKPRLLSPQNPGVLGMPRQSPSLKLYNERLCAVENPRALKDLNDFYNKLTKE